MSAAEEVRVCEECDLPKPVADYYARSKRVCKGCISAKNKRLYQERYRERYQENRGALIDSAKQWRSQQPPEYVAWIDMKQRCENQRNADYANYGGRGIAVCPEWRENFQRFLADMGPRPGPKYTLERRDINDPYCPSNCRWATNNDQQNNKRTNVICYLCGPDGPTYTAAELGRSMGMNPQFLRSLDLNWHRDGKPIPPLPYGVKQR
ncbi:MULTISPECIES: hypothetical protein [Ralstonia solanacearum species complex]|uniref:Uncharacterized protein n=2 Tax=Ralstonia solanacearum TaxID=305 RepID=A0ABF7RBM0_RALSL|nr:hypothetical protein [Ralstonia solanacearum]EAP72195.1 Conserved hypothetical protein [Ralstonia solanacearum UW551]MDN4066158.1 hypothetical protein [Ralstonia solanacearum]NUU73642.1 hypothetical protein [Ralstonia solanacearum]OCQ55886.1 hypothetical protein AR463_12420 [Ralstonia solanacearum]OCQ67554.1 hypothetical protein AR464_07640 [Ralstonia solanacearum]